MSVGPLRRIVGIVGLVALVPVAFHLATGTIDPEAAALRAVAIAVVVAAVGWVASAVIRSALHRIEPQPSAGELPADLAVGARAPADVAGSTG